MHDGCSLPQLWWVLIAAASVAKVGLEISDDLEGGGRNCCGARAAVPLVPDGCGAVTCPSPVAEFPGFCGRSTLHCAASAPAAGVLYMCLSGRLPRISSMGK